MSRSPPVVKEYIFFPDFDPSKITSSLFPFLITSLRAATTGVITVWSRQLRNRGRLNLIQTALFSLLMIARGLEGSLNLSRLSATLYWATFRATLLAISL